MRRARRERGFALVVVLGTLPVLAMLASQVELSARTELRLAGNLRAAAIRDAAADGAIRAAIFHLVAGDWQADGVPRRLRVGGAEVTLRIENENGKVNPGVAPLSVLRALLLAVGVDAARAESLAACIVDYRDGGDTPSPHGAKAAAYRAAGKAYGPSGLPFQRLDELRLVLGMTGDVYDRLLPYLSVYAGRGIDLAHADPVVAAAVRLAGPGAGALVAPAADTTLLAAISARALDEGGASAERRAIVRVYDTGSPDQPFEILEDSLARP